MIASADGGSTVSGVSGGLGNKADHAVFNALRRECRRGARGHEHCGRRALPSDGSVGSGDLRRVGQGRSLRESRAVRIGAGDARAPRGRARTLVDARSALRADRRARSTWRVVAELVGTVVLNEGGPTLARHGVGRADRPVLPEPRATCHRRDVGACGARSRRRSVDVGSRARLRRRRGFPLPPLRAQSPWPPWATDTVLAVGGFGHDTSTDRVLELRDGRTLGYSEFGDPGGAPVLNCHGGLVCRFDVEPCARRARGLGARVISPDRPGVGSSDRKPGRATVDWADDARELLDALGRRPRRGDGLVARRSVRRGRRREARRPCDSCRDYRRLSTARRRHDVRRAEPPRPATRADVATPRRRRPHDVRRCRGSAVTRRNGWQARGEAIAGADPR